MTTDEIVNYNTTNYIKVYKLNQLGLSNQEVADAMKPLFTTTKGVRNASWVKSVLKMYEVDPNLIKKANKIQD
jgi:hypothetical protein